MDLSQNINLKDLDCQENQISSLDFQQNTMLTQLNCSDNQLSNLNLDQNFLLKGLVCKNNHLTILNLAQNSFLNYFIVKNNQLTNLDFKNTNNQNLDYFSTENNPDLTCIFVDDKTYSQNNPDWHKDVTSNFVETQGECDALGINGYKTLNLKIYPNPVQTKLYLVASQEEIGKIILFNLQGKKIFFKNSLQTKETMDFSSLSSGIYFLKITSQNQTLTRKIIKL